MAMRPTTTKPNQTPALLTMGSGAVLALASFLPWAKVSVHVFTVNQSASTTGTDGGDGWITLGCGVVAIVAGAMLYSNMARRTLQAVLALAAGIIATVVGLIDFSDARSAASDIPASIKGFGGSVDASASFGLYLVIIAGIGAIVGGVMMLRGRNAGAPGEPPAPTTPPPSPTPPAP